VIIANLKAIGIEAKPDNKSGVAFREARYKGLYDILYSRWITSPDPIYSKFYGTTGLNNGTGYSNAALDTLRNKILPATVGKVPGAAYAVTGPTAQSVDENVLLKQKAPIVFGFVLVFAFILLLVSFRSIVIAVKAIVLNLLSVGAAYGVLVAVFQWGWGESFFGFQSNGGIASWLPIFMFVILFGLSMDYHVFILSRVREAYDRGLKTEDAVAHGITTTAGVVSSAALVTTPAVDLMPCSTACSVLIPRSYSSRIREMMNTW